MPQAPTATTPVTERLLDAAQKLLGERGIRATTMAQVAESAGVSRAWLYRHFPDKRALVGAVIVRLTGDFWAEAAERLNACESFAARVAAGVNIGRGAYDDPGALLLRLRTTEPEEFDACAGAGVTALVPSLAAFWRPWVDEAAATGEIAAGHDLAEVAEWIARVLISLGTSPGEHLDPDDAAAVRRHIDRYLMPALQTPPV